MPREPFQPVNELETVLVAASTDAAARPHFYRALMDSDVLIVPVNAPPIVNGLVQVPSNLTLRTIEVQGQAHTPFFSSGKRLPAGTQYLGLKVRALFEMTKGAHLALNPGSEFGKYFTPSEVEELLSGSLLAAQKQECYEAAGGSRQIIGQPKDYPEEFASALSRYFLSEPSVERAFLAQHMIVDIHQEPALLVAIETPASEFERIAAGVGVIARATKKAQNLVDVVRREHGDSKDYFSNQKPIYARRKRGLIQKIFGSQETHPK